MEIDLLVNVKGLALMVNVKVWIATYSRHGVLCEMMMAGKRSTGICDDDSDGEDDYDDQ